MSLDNKHQALFDVLCQMPFCVQSKEKSKIQRFFERGKSVWLEPGQCLKREGDPGDFYVLLEGKLRVTKKIDNQEIVLVTHKPGAFFGEVPLLLDAPFFVNAYAVEKCHLWQLNQEAFWETITTYPAICQTILRTLAQRLQNLELMSREREKLTSLNTLAGGLAHEINNPAASVKSTAGQLQQTLVTMETHALKLYELQPNLDKIQLLRDLLEQVQEKVQSPAYSDPIVQLYREDELTEWLESQGIREGWKLASTLVGFQLEAENLQALTAGLSVETRGEVLVWLEATLRSRELLNQVKHGIERICTLVESVKDYSYLDQAPQQLVDIHDGIESTLVMLEHKLKKHGVLVTREYERQLPLLNVYGSELNQVWTNLIDNAIDGLSEKSNGEKQIWIRTLQDSDFLVVEVVDNGMGIDPSIYQRLFEPFFTTKEVGWGIGLGLLNSYRIVVEHHKGDISVQSVPGNTRFRVSLPAYSGSRINGIHLGGVRE